MARRALAFVFWGLDVAVHVAVNAVLAVQARSPHPVGRKDDPTGAPWTNRRRESAPCTTRARHPATRPASGQTPSHGAVGGRFPARPRRRHHAQVRVRRPLIRYPLDDIGTAAPSAQRRQHAGIDQEHQKSAGRGDRVSRSNSSVILRHCKQQIRERGRFRLLQVTQALVLLHRQHHNRGLAAPRHPLRVTGDRGFDNRAEPVLCILQLPLGHEVSSVQINWLDCWSGHIWTSIPSHAESWSWRKRGAYSRFLIEIWITIHISNMISECSAASSDHSSQLVLPVRSAGYGQDHLDPGCVRPGRIAVPGPARPGSR